MDKLLFAPLLAMLSFWKFDIVYTILGNTNQAAQNRRWHIHSTTKRSKSQTKRSLVCTWSFGSPKSWWKFVSLGPQRWQKKLSNTSFKMWAVQAFFQQRRRSFCPLYWNKGIYGKKTGQIERQAGKYYFHFLDECLKKYYTRFDYSAVLVLNETAKCLPEGSIERLKKLGLEIEPRHSHKFTSYVS